MDKLNWLKQMVEQRPTDAQAYYWLGKELFENKHWIEAVQAFSNALTHCKNEELRLEIINDLSLASLSLQQAQATLSNTQLSSTDIDHDNDFSNEVQVEDCNETAHEFVEHNGEENDAVFHGSFSESVAQQTMHKTKFKVLDGNASKKELEPKHQQIDFSDVAGLEDLKKTIHLRIISPFYNKGLFAKFKKKAGGGVLLYGPPGCGKTYIAKATAGECHANFYPVHITDILDPYIGVSEQNLKDIFDKARLQKPSVLFFDEVDTIGFSRSKSTSYNRGVIDTFLTEMDGIDTSTDSVLIIAATNTPWDVDNALKRPGRFDRLIFVAPPDEKAREKIFQLKLYGRYAEQINTSLLAAETEFFSGADIENVVELASENVLEQILTTGIERPLKTDDLLQVLKNHQPSTLDWLRTAKNYVKYANQSGLYNDVEAYFKKHGRKI